MKFFLFAIVLLLTVLSVLAQETVNQSSADHQGDNVPSQLLQAVIDKNFDSVTAALQAGENIDLTNPNGWSAVRFAVSGNDLGMVQYLIDAGIDLNNPDNDGYTPLMIAASSADKEMVEALLAGNASPNMIATDGTTAYSSAVDSGRQLVALLIAEAGVLHGITDDNIEAIMDNLRHGAYANLRNDVGWTPLMMAAAKGAVDYVKEILGLPGADANRTENDGWTALHFAANNGNAEIVSVLLAANADPHIVAADGRTAKDLAKSQGFDNIVALLPDAPAEGA